MTNKPYPLLQSGFVSLQVDELKMPKITEPSFRQEILFKEYKIPLMNYFYSPEVTELFIRWNSNPASLKDFDFRERILKAAFRSFGTRSFFNWLDLQNGKGSVGAAHHEYLKQTIEYIYRGKERPVQNIQWTRLLEANEKSTSVRMDIQRTLNAGGGTSSGSDTVQGGNVSIDMRDVIMYWTMREDGFEDLLITLYNIFGGRTQRGDIDNSTS